MRSTLTASSRRIYSVYQRPNTNNPLGRKRASSAKVGLIVERIGAIQVVARQSRRFIRFASLDRFQNLAMLGKRELFESRLANQVEMKPGEPSEQSLAQVGEDRIARNDGDAVREPAIGFEEGVRVE